MLVKHLFGRCAMSANKLPPYRVGDMQNQTLRFWTFSEKSVPLKELRTVHSLGCCCYCFQLAFVLVSVYYFLPTLHAIHSPYVRPLWGF